MLKKFANVGFEQVELLEKQPCGMQEIRRYPLFTAEFLELLTRALSPERHGRVVWAITVRAIKP